MPLSLPVPPSTCTRCIFSLKSKKDLVYTFFFLYQFSKNEDLSMKKIFSSLLMTLTMLSGTAFADCQNDCCSQCFRSLVCSGGPYIGVTGLYVVPSETGLGDFTDSWQYADATSVTSLSKPSKARYKGAVGVLFGYDIPCTANNLEVEYVHVDNSKHNVNGSEGAFSFGSVFFNLVVDNPAAIGLVSDAHLNYSLNQVDVRLGHRFIGACNRLILNPSFGFRYTNLRHDLTFLVGNVKSTYRGIGPLLALNAQYSLWKKLWLAARFDSSVLMGRGNAHSILRGFGPDAKFVSPNRDRVIYTFGGRIGLAYDFCLCGSRLDLELGYQANIYVGPFDTLTGLVTPPTALGQRIHSIDTNNFAYSGPYLTLNWGLHGRR